MLSKAIALASQRHDGQYDKGGMPYILHVLKVMYYTKSEDQEILQIAAMHDLIEDTKTTFKELYELGFSHRVIAAIKLLTKLPGQSEDEYLEGICSSKDAMIVKLADLRHNSDLRRLKGVTEKDLARLNKYASMYQTIKWALEH